MIQFIVQDWTYNINEFDYETQLHEEQMDLFVPEWIALTVELGLCPTFSQVFSKELGMTELSILTVSTTSSMLDAMKDLQAWLLPWNI